MLIATVDNNRNTQPIAVAYCNKETHEDFRFVATAIKTAMLELTVENDGVDGTTWNIEAVMSDFAPAIPNGIVAALQVPDMPNIISLKCYPHMQRVNITPHIHAFIVIMCNLHILPFALF